MNRRLVLITVIAVLMIAAAGGGYLVRGHLGRGGAATPSSPQAATGIALAENLQMGFVDVAQHVRPARCPEPPGGPWRAGPSTGGRRSPPSAPPGGQSGGAGRPCPRVTTTAGRTC